MTDYCSQSPEIPQPLPPRAGIFKTSVLLTISCLLLSGLFSPASADILTRIEFTWSYDTAVPGLSGYRIYHGNQPVVTIADPYTLSTSTEVYLEIGTENTFTITAYDNLGNESSPSSPHVVSVPPEDETGNIPPVAKIEISSLSGPAPHTIDVSASKSIDYDGLITSYIWNFGDGGFSRYENDFHTFDTPGTYSVKLEVADNAGALSTTQTTVTVSAPELTTNAPPSALLYTTADNGPAPLDVLFDGTESTDADGFIVDYFWDFGDGSSDSGSFVNYTYGIIGTFTGKLTVTDDGGATGTDQTLITVIASDPLNNPPQAIITAAPLSGPSPLTITFSGGQSTDSDGTILSYKWDFGDGTTAQGADVFYQYIAPGTYTVTLTVTDDMGDTNQARISITATEEVLATSTLYSDDFSTDTSSAYVNINGSLTILDGAAHGAAWQDNLAHHTTSMGSSDHWIEADVTYNGLASSAGLIARVDPVAGTGYTAYFSAGKIQLNSFHGTSNKWLASMDGSYGEGTYALRMVINGSTIQVYVDGSLKIQKTDSTYMQGHYNGLRIHRGIGNADVTVDNIRAGTGAPPSFIRRNTLPVAQDTSITTFENTSINGSLIVSDLDGDPLTTSIITNGTLGNVTITDSGKGAYSYQPNPDATGEDTFTFKANDGIADSNVGTVTVTIVPVNKPPVATDGTVSTKQDVPASGTLVASDRDDDKLTYAIVKNGSLGTAVINDPSSGAFTYTPKPNTWGTDTFTFLANDGEADSNLGTITVTISQIISASGITDTFSTDTSNNYTAISGAMTIADGKAHGQQWTETRTFHKNAFTSDDQFVEADVHISGFSHGAGLLVRVDSTRSTGYLAYFENGRINLASFAGTGKQWLGQYNGSYTEGTYRLRVETKGNTIRIFVNSGLVLSKEDSTYTTGKHVGLRFNQGTSTPSMHLDNLNAGELSGAPATTLGITDTFSTDTSNNYTAISGAMTIADGKAHGQQWTDTRMYHNNVLEGADHFVEADVYYSGATHGAGLLIRVDPSKNTGYLAYFEGGRLHLASFAGPTKQWLALYDGSYTEGTYRLRVEAKDSMLSLIVNGVLVLNKEDTRYPSGHHVGLRFNQGSSSADMHLDNLTAGIRE